MIAYVFSSLWFECAPLETVRKSHWCRFRHDVRPLQIVMIVFWFDLHVVKGRIDAGFVFRLFFLGVHFLALNLEILLKHKASTNSTKMLRVHCKWNKIGIL